MAASVAFLHQVEYEAALNEYEEEAKRHHEEEEQELAARVNSDDARVGLQRAKPQNGRAVGGMQTLRRSVLKGHGAHLPVARSSASAVAHWLSDQRTQNHNSAARPGSAAEGSNGHGRTSMHGLRASGPGQLLLPPGPASAAASGAGDAFVGSSAAAAAFKARNGGFGGGAAFKASSKLLQSQPSMLRRSNSYIEMPGLWHRITHVDVRGVTDSILPICNPDTVPRRVWDLMVMSLVIWTVITVPLSVSYGLPHNMTFEVIGYLITGLFLLDVLVNFRTAYYNYQGELVRDSTAIASNYLKLWFWIDFFGTIPFDSIVMWTGALGGTANDSTTLAALGFLKAPRMLRLGRLLRFLDSYKNAKIFRIGQLFLTMLLISHWLACVWYMMYRFGGKDRAEFWAFEIASSEGNTGSELSYYVVSYYYSFLLLVGDNISAYNNFERAFVVVVLIAGTFFYSAVVGQMATLVATMNVAVNRHGQKLLMVQDALRYAGVPDEHSEKVQCYFEFLQQRSHPGAEGMQFLQELPAALHLSLCKFLHRRSLDKVPLFKDCEEGFLSAVSLRIRIHSLSPREVIFRVGDVGKEMYVIKKGNVAVTSPSAQMWGLLGPGEVFGEVALLSTGKRTANCTALGFVDLAVLTGPDLQAVMKDYPVSAALILERATQRAQALQTKSKMWLELSDDEDDMFFDGEEGQLEESEYDGGRSDDVSSCTPSNDGGGGGDGDGGGMGGSAPAKNPSLSGDSGDACSISTVNDYSFTGGRGRGGTNGAIGEAAGDGASTSMHGIGFGDGAAAAAGTDGGGGYIVRRLPPLTARQNSEVSMVESAAPSVTVATAPMTTTSLLLPPLPSPRPMSAINGKRLPTAWHDGSGGTEPRRSRSVPQASVELPTSPPSVAITDLAEISRQHPSGASIDVEGLGRGGLEGTGAAAAAATSMADPNRPLPSHCDSHLSGVAVEDQLPLPSPSILLGSGSFKPATLLTTATLPCSAPMPMPHSHAMPAFINGASSMSPSAHSLRCGMYRTASQRRRSSVRTDASPSSPWRDAAAVAAASSSPKGAAPSCMDSHASLHRISIASWLPVGDDDGATGAAGNGVSDAVGAHDYLEADSGALNGERPFHNVDGNSDGGWMGSQQLRRRSSSDLGVHLFAVAAAPPATRSRLSVQLNRSVPAAMPPPPAAAAALSSPPPPPQPHQQYYRHEKQRLDDVDINYFAVSGGGGAAGGGSAELILERDSSVTLLERFGSSSLRPSESPLISCTGDGEPGGSAAAAVATPPPPASAVRYSASQPNAAAKRSSRETSLDQPNRRRGTSPQSGHAAAAGSAAVAAIAAAIAGDPYWESAATKAVSASAALIRANSRGGSGGGGGASGIRSGPLGEAVEDGAAATTTTTSSVLSDAAGSAIPYGSSSNNNNNLSNGSMHHRLSGLGGGSLAANTGPISGVPPAASAASASMSRRSVTGLPLHNRTNSGTNGTAAGTTGVASTTYPSPIGVPPASLYLQRISFTIASPARSPSLPHGQDSSLHASPSPSLAPQASAAATTAPAATAAAAATTPTPAPQSLLPPGAAILRLARRNSNYTLSHENSSSLNAVPMPANGSPMHSPGVGIGVGIGGGGGGLLGALVRRATHRTSVNNGPDAALFAAAAAQPRHGQTHADNDGHGEAAAGAAAGGGGSGGGGDGLEWISTRVGRRFRHNSVEILHEEELAALAPRPATATSTQAAATGATYAKQSFSGATNHSTTTAHGNRRHYTRSSAEGGGRRGSVESLQTSVRQDDVDNSMHGSVGGGGGGGGGSRRLSTQDTTCSRCSRCGTHGGGQSRPPPAPAPPPPSPPLPPPPDGVFVPRAAWKELLQAVSRLGFFEDAVQQLLDLVSQQDEALGRLEARAERAAALNAHSAHGAHINVLGIHEHHAHHHLEALTSSTSGGAAGGAATSTAATVAAVNAAASAARAAQIAMLGGGPLPPLPLPPPPQQLRSGLARTGSTLRLGAGTGSGGGGIAGAGTGPGARSGQRSNGNGSSAAMVTAAAAAVASTGTATSQQSSSGAARMRGAVRAMAASSRLRLALANRGGGPVPSSSTSSGGGENPGHATSMAGGGGGGGSDAGYGSSSGSLPGECIRAQGDSNGGEAAPTGQTPHASLPGGALGVPHAGPRSALKRSVSVQQ
ncbi:hypothetical protein Agub_g13688 [Astrephomene gubernaculifera]|uniref:Cyclic nucleotide-binding domain-containing protein n=1 Tax=Astrephomene gubernaculifera TaxID=47775 RepID=A0AAD3E2V5_9CHLO|nr:hypothetical protein Agub_g13688 [Astrephomene gubernaculifera]